MKFFYWVVFGIFLATSFGLNLNEAAAEKYGYTKMRSMGNKSTVEAVPKKNIKFLPEEETDGPDIKVLVIKKTEIKSLVDSIKKNYRAYTGINRYEIIDKASSSLLRKIALATALTPPPSIDNKYLVLVLSCAIMCWRFPGN